MRGHARHDARRGSERVRMHQAKPQQRRPGSRASSQGKGRGTPKNDLHRCAAPLLGAARPSCAPHHTTGAPTLSMCTPGPHPRPPTTTRQEGQGPDATRPGATETNPLEPDQRGCCGRGTSDAARACTSGTNSDVGWGGGAVPLTVPTRPIPKRQPQSDPAREVFGRHTCYRSRAHACNLRPAASLLCTVLARLDESLKGTRRVPKLKKASISARLFTRLPRTQRERNASGVRGVRKIGKLA